MADKLEESLAASLATWPAEEKAPPIPIDIVKAIRTAYPQATLEDIKASLSHFLKCLFSKPAFSELNEPKVHVVKTATIGSFAVYYYVDWPKINASRMKYNKKFVLDNTHVVLMKCRARDGRPSAYGLFGGYTNLGGEHTAGEAPRTGARREFIEEAVDPSGTPIIPPPKEHRYRLLVGGIGYSTPEMPRAFEGYGVELIREEFDLFKIQAERAQEEIYRRGIEHASEGEVLGIAIMPLSEAIALTKEGFTRRDQFRVIEELKSSIEKQIEHNMQMAKARM
jgi:hypothetical protein